jgi:MFS family permease
MSKYDDEFKNVKKGLHNLPPENTTQKTRVNFLAIFIVAGIVLAIAILLFQELIVDTGENLRTQSGYIFIQIIINGVLALIIGGIQAWIFKARIKSRVYVFIGFSLLGGVIAGLFGGMLIDAGSRTPFLVGAITGLIAGGISSMAQNSVMGNKKDTSKWLIYSIISWTVIFAIGWTIGWDPENVLGLAAAAAFLLFASGVSLVLFLNNTPQIEFS